MDLPNKNTVAFNFLRVLEMLPGSRSLQPMMRFLRDSVRAQDTREDGERPGEEPAGHDGQPQTEARLVKRTLKGWFGKIYKFCSCVVDRPRHVWCPMQLSHCAYHRPSHTVTLSSVIWVPLLLVLRLFVLNV